MKSWKSAGLAVVFFPLFGLVACSDGQLGSPEDVASAASPLTSADTCPGTRWVGRVDQGGFCPGPTSGGWLPPQRLFAGIAPSLPPELDPYCLYELNHGGLPTPTELAGLPAKNAQTPASQWLSADCMVVAAQGDTKAVIAAITPELDQSFAAAAEVPTTFPPPPDDGQPVRIAIVDSWPGPTSVGNLDHGFGMAAIIRRLSCGVSGAPGCFAIPVPHLALNLIKPGVRDDLGGGYFGFQGRLAWSIFEAVHAWQSAPPGSKLIINLSVGWEAQYNASEAAGATRAALEYAACQGALVIAAAGNAGTGPTSTPGPLYPAAWNQVAAPSCGLSVTRPLVYAVGGVDGRDLPLANTRSGGRAVLAAPAFQVPGVMNIGGGGSTFVGPFTGSSVSAAVTSSIAAAVWHHDSSLRADQVMEIVGSTAIPSPDVADFCLSGPCPTVRRVSMCRALELASGTALTCAKHGHGTGQNPIISPADRGLMESFAAHNPVHDGRGLDQLVTPVGCVAPVYTLLSMSYPPLYNPCPTETLPNETVAPSVCPQPGNDPCPACMLAIPSLGDPVILLGIDEHFNGGVIPQTLTVTERTGTKTIYDLGRAFDSNMMPLAAGLYGGNVYKVVMPSLSTASSIASATIEWTNSITAAMASSSLIVQQ